MKQIFFVALLVLFTARTACAQTNFKKGWVITSKGDTLHGYIAYREWTQTPAQFSFSAQPAGVEAKTVTVQEAQAVTLEEYGTYRRFPVSISMNPTEDWKLDFAADTSLVNKTVFLRLVAEGVRVSLYAYRDRLKDRYYITSSSHSAPVELLWKKEAQGQQITNLPLFRRQLMSAAGANAASIPGLQAQIDKADYAERDLKAVVNRLNGQPEAGLAVEKNTARRGRFFAGLGVNYSRLTYKGENLINANGLDANGNTAYKPQTQTSSVLPVGWGGYDVFFHPSVERTFLRLEAAVTALQSTTTSVYRYSRVYDEELTNRYKLFAVFFSFTPQLAFTFYQRQNLAVFAGAGLMARYAAYPKQTVYQTTNKQGQGFSDKVIEHYFGLESFVGIPVARIGVTAKKKWAASATFMAPRLLTPTDKSVPNSVKERSLQAGINYLF